jgi:uncharacterized protein (DUF58 family)
MSRLSDYLWRSPLFPRKLSFTREGKAIVLISLGLGLAAVNTGNNLLYLVFGLSLSLIVVSGVLSESNLRGLEIGNVGFVRPSAGEPVLVVVPVACRRKRFPAFSIEAWPLIDGGVRVEPARFLELRPGASATAACQLTFERRGEHRVRGLVLSTSFPFSFFRKSLVTPVAATVIVHPRLRPPPSGEPEAVGGGDEVARPAAGRGVEFFGARDWREGDNPRHVLHRLSAVRAVPVVREFEDEGVRRSFVAIVNVDDGGEAGEARVEAAIEIAAGAAAARLRAGESVGVAAATGAVEPAAGPVQVEKVLDFLATLPVLAMNEPGVEAQVRKVGGWPEGTRVLWVRP